MLNHSPKRIWRIEMNIKEIHLISNNDGTYKLYYELMGVDGRKIKVTIPRVINLEYYEKCISMKYNNMSVDMIFHHY